MILVVIASLVGVYPIFRYSGRFTGGGDASNFLQFAAAIQDQGILVPDRHVYAHGYAYQTLAVSVSSLSGLELDEVQFVLGYLFLAWPIALAWLFYREILESSQGAFLASMILLVQPDVLFPLMRGTHEKFTRGLMFLALYLLVRNVRGHDKLVVRVGMVLAFYIVAFALVSMNSLFATSFVTGLCLTGLLIWAAFRYLRLSSWRTATLYVAGISVIIQISFILFLYEPAKENILIFESMVQKALVVSLGAEAVSADPYGGIQSEWSGTIPYFVLVFPTLITLIGSAIIWLIHACDVILRRRNPGNQRLFLLALYAAFAAIFAVTVVSDLIGAFRTANLQIRFVPNVAMFATPICASWLATTITRSSLQRRIVSVTLLIAFALSVIKATNDPVASNRFPHYQQTEVEAIHWALTLQPDQWLWVGTDNRLQSEIANRVYLDPVATLHLDRGGVDDHVRNLLVSDLLRIQSRRYAVGLPLEGDSLRIYDNGSAEIYHLRPRTPFQR